jgi:hypothetical protein
MFVNIHSYSFIFSGYVQNFHQSGNKVLFLHSPESYINATTMSKFFSFINKCGHRNVLSKRQVWMSILHIINLKEKKIMDIGVLDFFNKKPILDYFICLKSGPVFLFQIFIIDTLSLPRDIKLYH